MLEESNLSKIEALCNQIMNSPYMQKEAPIELKNLRSVIEKVNLLIKEDVPALVSEVRKLRSQNKRLEAEIEAMHPSMVITE